nr:helix-turn-helix transcriptional regulator [Faecalibacterium sp. OF04-11AC]
MSQAELASKLGVTQQAVGKWESGKSSPDPTTVARIAEILSTTRISCWGCTARSPAATRRRSGSLATMPRA